MRSDDEDRPPEDGEGAKPTRDEKGRWMKGYCPNPNGRPKKKPKKSVNQSDLHIFGNSLIEVVVNGERTMVDRRFANLNKMFERAMNGSVTMQRYLYEQFEKNDERLAEARIRYDELLNEWFFQPRRAGRKIPDMPFEVELEIISLQSILHHHYPDSYPPPDRLFRRKESDDESSDDNE